MSHGTLRISLGHGENFFSNWSKEPLTVTAMVFWLALGAMTSLSSCITSPTSQRGQRSSVFQRKLGPDYHRHPGWNASMGNPRDPSSAGFRLPGTWCHWPRVVCLCISSSLVATKQWNLLVSFLMYWSTVSESVQNVTWSTGRSSSALIIRTVMRLAMSSRRGIVGLFTGELWHFLKTKEHWMWPQGPLNLR